MRSGSQPGGVGHGTARATSGERGSTVVVDDRRVAILLLDTRGTTVVHANAEALLLVGGRVTLPATVSSWVEAARLEGLDRPDDLALIADESPGVGRALSVRDDVGDVRVFWASATRLVDDPAQGPSGVMVALLPLAQNASGDDADPLLPLSPGVPIVSGLAVTRSRTVTSSVAATSSGAALSDVSDAAAADVVEQVASRAVAASSVSFSICDPRMPDAPLVWVNAAFEQLTGYHRVEILGRNCRFLQGPATDPAQVARVHEALVRGEAVYAELLNYRADGSTFWNALSISPVLDGNGRLTHVVGVQADITALVLAGAERDRLLQAERTARREAQRSMAEALRSRSHLAFLARVGMALSQTLDSQDACDRVVAAAVPELADWCALDLVCETSGTVRRVSVAHRDPARADEVARAGALEHARPRTSVVARVLSGDAPVLIQGPSDLYGKRDGELAGVLAALEPRAGIVVPLRARGRVIGALTLVRAGESGPGFDDSEAALAASVASRAALAVDNAMLFEAERAQRRRADLLASVGAALGSSLRSAELLDVLVRQLVPGFADVAVVHLEASYDPSPANAMDGGPGAAPTAGLRPAAVHDAGSPSHTGGQAVGWTVGEGTAGPGRAWATGEPQLIRVVGPEQPELAGEGLTSVISVPLRACSTAFGALTLGRRSGPGFTDDELDVAAELGRRSGLAVENARLYERERFVAVQLQRSLLPASLPTVPGLDLAGRYLAGAVGTEVGGDWYDVVALPDGRAVVVVGDVMGRGVHAAAVMGQLRASLRSYAAEGFGPGELLVRLSRFTSGLERDTMATCLVALIDPAAGTVRMASAGHPPPVLLRSRSASPAGMPGTSGSADGPGATDAADSADVTGSGVLVVDTADIMSVEPGVPLGVDAGPGGEVGYRETHLALAPGSTLLLFTDGLVESRGTAISQGLDRLTRGMVGRSRGVAAAADLCAAALSVMGHGGRSRASSGRQPRRREGGTADDVAVLAVRALEMPVAAASPTVDDETAARSAARPAGRRASTPSRQRRVPPSAPVPGRRPRPPSGQQERMRITLDPRPEAAAFARGRVRDAMVLHGMGERADTAVLLVSELVTNALRHGGGPHELVLAVDSEGITVTVGDRSAASPRPRQAVHDMLSADPATTADREGGLLDGDPLDGGPLDRAAADGKDDELSEDGRGLLLVEALADTWGWSGTKRGKRVWFTLRRDAAA
jgi:PAS domain S-box-containing protein